MHVPGLVGAVRSAVVVPRFRPRPCSLVRGLLLVLASVSELVWVPVLTSVSELVRVPVPVLTSVSALVPVPVLASATEPVPSPPRVPSLHLGTALVQGRLPPMQRVEQFRP